jgi:hypothetical protein
MIMDMSVYRAAVFRRDELSRKYHDEGAVRHMDWTPEESAEAVAIMNLIRAYEAIAGSPR